MDKNLYIISGCNGAGKTTASYLDFYFGISITLLEAISLF